MLDTNIASAALKGDERVDANLLALDPAEWCISAITRAELRYGLALRPKARSLSQLVEAFLSSSRTAPWDQSAADVHGMLRANLRRRGTPIGDFDTMIAAHALTLDAVLVTDNLRHFSVIEGLALENWIRD